MPRRTLPPLNAVRAFEAAARRNSIKEAAVELGVTHGAISRQVQLLEEWLGGPPLFRRSNRGVTPTPGGAALLAAFGPALDRIATATTEYRRWEGADPSTTLRVNALATFSLRWLLPRLAQFRAHTPGIEVQLTTGNDPVDALPEDYDVVIRGGPDAYHGFASRHLLPESRLPVCSPSLLLQTPLASVTDLKHHTLLHVASMPRLWRDWLVVAGHLAVQPVAGLTLDHFYLSIQAAIDGLGVAMGPATLVGDDIAAGRLVAPFPGLSLPARSYFAYLPQRATATAGASTTFCNWIENIGNKSI